MLTILLKTVAWKIQTTVGNWYNYIFKKPNIIWLKCEPHLDTVRPNTIYFQLFKEKLGYTQFCPTYAYMPTLSSVSLYLQNDNTYQEYEKWMSYLYLRLITLLSSSLGGNTPIQIFFTNPLAFLIYKPTYIRNPCLSTS